MHLEEVFVSFISFCFVWFSGFRHAAVDVLSIKEYFVPRRRAAEALRALAAISGRFRGWLMASEIRAIAADALLLSPHRLAEEGSVSWLVMPFVGGRRGKLLEIFVGLATGASCKLLYRLEKKYNCIPHFPAEEIHIICRGIVFSSYIWLVSWCWQGGISLHLEAGWSRGTVRCAVKSFKTTFQTLQQHEFSGLWWFWAVLQKKNPKTSDTSVSGHFSGAARDRRCLGSLRCGAALGQDLFDATTSWLDSIWRYFYWVCRRYWLMWCVLILPIHSTSFKYWFGIPLHSVSRFVDWMWWTLSSRRLVQGLERLYGNALVEFRQLAQRMDPEGKFCNENLALSIGTNIERMCEQKGIERKFKKFKKWFWDLMKILRWVEQTIGDYTRECTTSALWSGGQEF